MKKKRNSRKKQPGKKPDPIVNLEFLTEMQQLKQQLSQATESLQMSEERLQDLEIHVNLLTRLLTTLCIEKFGLRVGVLKRLIKRIEKEAIRDSQIMQLESLYQLPPKKKNNHRSTPRIDPWEEIS